MSDPIPYRNLIIVRPAAEVVTKSRRTRKAFQSTLQQNVRDALTRAEVPHRLTKDFSRLFIETEASSEVLRVLPYIFGVGSFSPVEATTEADLDAIVQVGAEAFVERVRGKRYAVRAKRLGQYPFTSAAIERRLGAILNPFGTVDLDNPEVTVSVELHNRNAYLFTERHRGAGGLPRGVQGHAITLISGGFDSAVAAWRLMKRGVAMDYLFCNLGGSAYERMVLQVAKVLTEAWDFGQRPRLYVVDFDPILRELHNKVRTEYWQVVLKRLMYRTASQLASELQAEAVATGEALGQVSSQTLSNLHTIDVASQVPVLRPLIGFDKQEIIDQARYIGTAPISERVKEYCALASDRPLVRSKKEKVDLEEGKVDLALLGEAVSTRKQIDLQEVTPADLRRPYLFTKEIPEGAIVIDCQPRHLHQAWHVPHARHYQPAELMDQVQRLDKDHTYVLYCTWGTQTPYLAELMQQLGYEAYAFEGGVSHVKQYYMEHQAD